jgi:hypothetical protein
VVRSRRPSPHFPQHIPLLLFGQLHHGQLLGVHVALDAVSYEAAQRRRRDGLLSGRDGFERVAEASRTTQLNLDEDEGFFFADDQVDLPAARPVVALDEPVAAPGQLAQREVLPPRSGGLSLVSPPPRRSLGGGRGTGLVLRGHFDVRRCHSHGCARTHSRHGAPRGHASRRPARLWPPR